MRIKTVLCPVDGSTISEQAVAYAIVVARQFSARLDVIEVIDWTLPPISGVGVEFLDMPPEVQREVLAQLERMAAPARASGIPTEVAVDSGPVVRGILTRAENVSADLIVIGTHGRSGFERLALGSVAEKVLRKASCPVLTVPPAAGRPGDAPFSKILCAVDLSPASKAAVRTAAAVALRSGGELSVLHVIEWPFGPAAQASPAAELLLSLREKAQTELAALLADADLPGPVSTAIQTGVPKQLILNAAHEQRADLLVLSVSGRNAIDRALLGSTTHGVIVESTCPVLTARVVEKE